MIVSNRKITSSVFRWTINSHPLEITSKTTHVGIQISSDMKSDYTIENAVRKGRAAFHSALGFSFKEQMLLSPVTSLRLYKSVVQPTFVYGCEMWSNMSLSSMKAIEVFHRYCIKKFQHLPVTIRTAMCQTLLGVGSLIGDVDKKKLMFFHRILSLPERALTKQIFLRRLFLHQHRTMSSCTVKHLGFILDWGGRVVRRCWVNFQCRGVLLIWITVGQGLIVLAVGAGGGCLDIFSLIYRFSFLSPSLWETARYRLKYCLKGPLSPKQPTNQPIYSRPEKDSAKI